MARAKKGPKKMPVTAADASEAKTRPVRLDLPPDIHRLLRLIAADEDVSMASYARDLVAKHLKEEAKRRGLMG